MGVFAYFVWLLFGLSAMDLTAAGSIHSRKAFLLKIYVDQLPTDHQKYINGSHTSSLCNEHRRSDQIFETLHF